MIANKRSELDVIADILRIKGSKTAIMYGANLSYAQTQRYLELLHEAGFLQQGPTGKNGRRAYSPTEKGQKLLKLVEIIEEMLDASIKRNGTAASSRVSKTDGEADPFAIDLDALAVYAGASTKTNGSPAKKVESGSSHGGFAA